MNPALAALAPPRRLPGWLPAALFLGGTALAGPALGAAARPAFLVGCAAIGWFAWKRSPADHLQAALLLFSFAPFLRRLVDLAAGYEPSGLMLLGPLLAIVAPAHHLAEVVTRERPLPPILGPLLVVGACTLYALVLTLLQGDLTVAAASGVKWLAPLVYGALVALRPAEERAGMTRAAAGAFLVVLPVTGLYGIAQYVDPPAWDRYWMSLTTIMSAGLPVPYGVRTFSTMNGPSSFATFTAAGLLLVGFLARGRWALLLAGPAAISLLLSLYRTAWMCLPVSVGFCLLFAVTRGRALGIIAGATAAIGFSAAFTPFGETIGDRLSSFGEGSRDGSARERLEEFVTLWNWPDSGLVGTGFTMGDVGSAGTMPIDGMIVTCWAAMGIVVGLCCLAALVWAPALAIRAAWRDPRRETVVLGSLACGTLIQLPLTNLTSGELGVLFWLLLALGAEDGEGRRGADRAPAPAGTGLRPA
ncbi:O-antigen ligase domain-containing protein [Methylobacterium sp. JK268]